MAYADGMGQPMSGSAEERPAVEESAAQPRDADKAVEKVVEETSGAADDVFREGYLDVLREDWPD